MQEAVKKSLKQAAILTKEEATRNCPVDTGFLRSSLYYRVADFSYTVGVKASYGGYVEFGTRYMMAQPYLRPAFIFVTRTITSAMSKEILKELEAL